MDPAELTFWRAQGGVVVGELPVRVRNTGTAPVANLVLRLSLPPGLGPAGDGWDSCVRLPAGERSVELECLLGSLAVGDAFVTTYAFQATGEPWLTAQVTPSLYLLHIEQREPYTYEDGSAPEVAITFVAPGS